MTFNAKGNVTANADRPTPETASKPAKPAGSVEIGVTVGTEGDRVLMRIGDGPFNEVARLAPNIKFVGRAEYDAGKRKILKPNDPIDRFSDAGRMYLLPPADFQKRRRLFYHESAATIAATFPNLYKLVRSK